MNILVITHFLNGLLMIALPVGLGIFLTRRFHLGWRLWWIGAGTFILSQVGHIPFNAGISILFNRGILPAPPEAYRLVFNALVLGLSAGIWEELARYAAYRWWAKDARSWARGLLLGAGHGGIEAIVFGALVLLTYLIMLAIQNIDLSGMLPADQLVLLEEQKAVYWSLPWYLSLFGSLERALTIPVHLSLSILVLQCFTRRRMIWLWAAIGWHALLDAAAVYTANVWGAYMAELIIGLFTCASLVIIFILRRPEPPAEPAPEPIRASDSSILAQIDPPDISSEKLDESRYQ